MAETTGSIVFPHFKTEEVEVAKRFLASGRLTGKWSFWIVLDTPASLAVRDRGAGEEEVWMWQLQADAICETDSDIWIVEFKERVRPSGIGQLLTYRYFYRKIYKPSKPVKMVMVATIDDEAIREVCQEIGIKVELV